MKIRLLVSIIILITVAFYCQTCGAEVTPQVNTDKKVYNYGEQIKVNFSNAPGDDHDWICIVEAGSPDNEAGDYQNMPKGAVQGVLTFEAPKPGTYEVRAYYNYASKGYVVSVRYAFTVASSPDYEKMAATRVEIAARLMERKINPSNPLEANMPPEKGLVYIVREPWAMTDNVDVQIKANEKLIVVIPGSKYYLYSVPAGDINFSTGDLIELDTITGESRQAWSVRKGETTISIKAGCVYYLKLKVIPMGGLGTYLENVPHEEGAKLIDSYKLTLLK